MTYPVVLPRNERPPSSLLAVVSRLWDRYVYIYVKYTE